MCLILVAYGMGSAYPFVVAANRDEFYDRPTAKAHYWSPTATKDNLTILAGKDLQAGGTWLGITKTAPFRFAAVTNYREAPSEKTKQQKSRGGLVTDFLTLDLSATAKKYLQGIQSHAGSYAGFNLLVADDTGLWYFSNRGDQGVRRLEPGRVYGLCNRLLDDPWPKVNKTKQEVSAMMEKMNEQTKEEITEKLCSILKDTIKAPDEALPSTGVSFQVEQLLSSIFIESDWYGTRATTVLFVQKDVGDPNRLNFSFTERSYGLHGKYLGEVKEEFELDDFPEIQNAAEGLFG